MDPKDIGKVKAPAMVDPDSPYLQDFNQRTWSELSQKYQRGETALAAKVAKRAMVVYAADQKIAWEEMRVASLCFPRASTRWASLTNFEKMAILHRVAHKPILLAQGLTKAAVNDDNAFMVYQVNPKNNNSKFYEGLVIPADGGYRVIRRWGALTDSGQTGRIDGTQFDEDPRGLFPTEAAARRELQTHYAKRIAHGYVDAFGPKHVTPDGHKLPMGEYPVGLTRSTGFGWGSQSVTRCIPALRMVHDAISQALLEIAGTGKSAVIESELNQAVRLLDTVALVDSTMAQKILGFFGKSLRRLSGSPRFLPDVDGRNLAKELATAKTYITKQLSLCND